MPGTIQVSFQYAMNPPMPAKSRRIAVTSGFMVVSAAPMRASTETTITTATSSVSVSELRLSIPKNRPIPPPVIPRASASCVLGLPVHVDDIAGSLRARAKAAPS